MTSIDTATRGTSTSESPTWPDIRLLGFVRVGEPMAILHVGRRTMTASVGDTVSGQITLLAIQNPDVVLTDGTRTIRLYASTPQDRPRTPEQTQPARFEPAEVRWSEKTHKSADGMLIPPLPPLPSDISEKEISSLEQAHSLLPSS